VGESPLFCWIEGFVMMSSAIVSKNGAIMSKIEAIAERVAGSEGIEVVEVELKGGGKSRFLRISIDKPEGVTHADCELISHQVGTILDVENVVPGSYTLEVSSPGVERKLLKYKDFERFLGKKIKAVLREPIESSRSWEGILTACANGQITLDVTASASAAPKTIQFPFDQVEKANLKFEWGTRSN
jgi:ribosome maturation factor RimP